MPYWFSSEVSSLSFRQFPRLSPFLVVLLTLLTLGFYLPWWLYTRSQILNRIYPQKPISQFLIALCMGGLIMMIALVFQIPQQASVDLMVKTPEFQRVMDVAMVLNFLQFIWALIFCQRLNLCSQRQMGDPLYASYFILLLSHLFIVSIFYLQYKLNQFIDQNAEPQSPIGIM
jgi:hypothetical protein